MIELQEKLIDVLTTKFDMPEEQIRGGSTFEEVGLDSLVLLEVALLINREMGVFLSEEELLPSFTVTDLTTLLETKRQAA